MYYYSEHILEVLQNNLQTEVTYFKTLKMMGKISLAL